MAEILIIGPSGVGKSTLGKLLAARLGLQQVSLDTLRWGYYKELGYDEEYARNLRATQGFPALVTYWKQFDADVVLRALAEHPQNCVIDFGGGHSVFDNEDDFQRVEQTLAPYPNVILLLPSPDLDESVQIITEIQQQIAPVADRGIVGGLIEYQVKNPSNQKLAKIVIYTKDKTPEEICAEALGKIQQ